MMAILRDIPVVVVTAKELTPADRRALAVEKSLVEGACCRQALLSAARTRIRRHTQRR